MTQPATTIPNEANGIKEIANLARNSTGLTIQDVPVKDLGAGLPPSVPLVIDNKPNGSITSLRHLIENYRTAPEARKGLAKASTLQSFIDLSNRHKDADSVVFANTAWPTPSLLAVLDYHKADGTPRWSRHLIQYDFPVTDELKAWIGTNGKVMEQADFARFLEDHAAELSAPTAGEVDIYERLFKEKLAIPIELIGLSRDLEVHVGAKVKRAERLISGERTVEFVEEHMDANGDKVQIPGAFIVSVQAFVDGDAVRIPARLRYRMAGGGIHWFYQLYRWEFWLRERVQQDLRKAGVETALPTFEGTPEV